MIHPPSPTPKPHHPSPTSNLKVIKGDKWGRPMFTVHILKVLIKWEILLYIHFDPTEFMHYAESFIVLSLGSMEKIMCNESHSYKQNETFHALHAYASKFAVQVYFECANIRSIFKMVVYIYYSPVEMLFTDSVLFSGSNNLSGCRCDNLSIFHVSTSLGNCAVVAFAFLKNINKIFMFFIPGIRCTSNKTLTFSAYTPCGLRIEVCWHADNEIHKAYGGSIRPKKCMLHMLDILPAHIF